MSVPFRPAVILVIGLLALAACSPSTGESPGGSGSGLSGDIQISGSSTVLPISSRAFEAFTATHAHVSGFVDGPGTGDGFALFCSGETDISDASRPIHDDEAAACDENGVEYVELKVAIDGLSVITSAANVDLDCLSFLDLYALLGPESENFTNWADANDLSADLDAELGDDFGASHATYPDEALTVTAPSEESGTFDTFVDLVLADIAEVRGVDGTTRPDYQGSPDDNVIIAGVAGTADAPFTLGWVGFAYAIENTDRVRLVPVDGGSGCVPAEVDTISSAEYPIARFLYIYVNTGNAAENPALEAFVDFYLSDEGMASVSDADYVQLAEVDLEASRAAWDAR